MSQARTILTLSAFTFGLTAPPADARGHFFNYEDLGFCATNNTKGAGVNTQIPDAPNIGNTGNWEDLEVYITWNPSHGPNWPSINPNFDSQWNAHYCTFWNVASDGTTTHYYLWDGTNYFYPQPGMNNSNSLYAGPDKSGNGNVWMQWIVLGHAPEFL